MNQNFKKFLIAFLSTAIFSVLIYFLLKFYDPSWKTLEILHQNLYYIIFLLISIIFSLTLYWNDNKKSQLIISIIILINFLYIVFLFWVSNIWLSQNQWIFLIWFLILWLISNYIKNIFGHTVTIISVFWIIITIFFSIIPLYAEGPDIVWFEKIFSNQIMTYSKIEINQSMTVLEKDDKKYKFKNWLFSYDFKINENWSQIIFKSNKLYQNTFTYILLPNKEIVQIYPQSAINIDKNMNIDIITGIIKYYPQNPKNLSFTWDIIPSIMVDQENINIVLDRYDNQLKEYIYQQVWWEINQNKNVIKASKTILEFLNKILPNQFKNNLENFKNFEKYLKIEKDDNNYKNEISTDKIQKNIIKDIIDSTSQNKIIK